MVIQLAKNIMFPPCLKSLLESTKVLKVGNYINWEIKYLKEDWDVKIPEESCRWINRFAKEKLFTRKANRNLDDLCRIVLKKSCPKDGREPGQEELASVRVSKWSKENLTAEQIIYAARDAIASLMIDDAIEARSRNTQPLSFDEDFIAPELLNRPSAIHSSVHSPDTPIANGQFHQRVINDIFHIFQRLKVSPKHPFQYAFKSKFRDACLIPNVADKKDVTEKLAQRPIPTTFEHMVAENPEWVWQRVRRYVPEPTVLLERVKAVLVEFCKQCYNDSNGVPVLNDATKEEIRKIMGHISRGCLSDPPAIPMYYPVNDQHILEDIF